MPQDWSAFIQLAKNLGTPGLTIASLVVGLLYLARQLIRLRIEFEKSKVDSASALIRLWSQLEAKKPKGESEEYEALRKEILRRLGVPERTLARREDLVLNLASISPLEELEPKSNFEIALDFGSVFAGAVASQIIRVVFLTQGVEGTAVALAPYLTGVVLIALASSIAAFAFVGARVPKLTYFIAGFVAGLAIPYVLGALTEYYAPQPRMIPGKLS